MFNVNQIVKGHVAGTFIVLGYRNVGGECFVQVKPYDLSSGKAGKGEFCLPESALKSI